ncbi:MAG: ABC transporter ATP-binding protein [Lactimicrobium sp.]|jgi:ATP-binding cassette subfamily B multidrug efflux pump|uniref:ABC transporter ATP-binding protein n=1 Tax=Lactimicrobium sp. TaxID=2563780 RepID=UPI002F354F5B
MKKNKTVASLIRQAIVQHILLTIAVCLIVVGAIVTSLIPPLILQRIIDGLSTRASVSPMLFTSYFATLILSSLLASGQEAILVVFGQKMTHAMRSALSEKMEHLPADFFTRTQPGAIVSRFIYDVDTIEELFTEGIISMFADCCRMVSIFVILFMKNKGLAIVLLCVLPLVALYTRHVQKATLEAQLDNRKAVASVSSAIPETLHNIRTIHTLQAESFMAERYDESLDDSFRAIEKTNFFDAVYSPAILITNAAVTTLVYILSASGSPIVLSFFGMTPGTSVAIINYISQIFSPIESIGMEIQTVQSASAGIHRINEFLGQPERTIPDLSFTKQEVPAVSLSHVSFAYDASHPVLQDLSFTIKEGEHVTIAGRTGAGKSTLFKLILGLYHPDEGSISIFGCDAAKIKDTDKRSLFGYVEQTFRPVEGTIKDQLTLHDASVSDDEIMAALKTVGLDKTIASIPDGLDTPYSESLFSQGQKQLLSIARSIIKNPSILLLDEITANLDAETERTVLDTLIQVSKNRTVVSISHRLYEAGGGRMITIGTQKA